MVLVVSRYESICDGEVRKNCRICGIDDACFYSNDYDESFLLYVVFLCEFKG